MRILFVFSLLLHGVMSAAPDGVFNQLFGSQGIVPLIDPSEQVIDLQVQNDGRIVGVTSFDGRTVFRLHPDGSYDRSFGVNGTVTLSAQFVFLNTVLLQPDGKIVVGGYNTDTFAFMRLLSNGQPDTTFGTNGFAEFAGGGLETAALQDDLKIVGVGYSITQQAVMKRITSNGQLDTTFAITQTNLSGLIPGAIGAAFHDICIESSGKIIVAGGVDVSGDVLGFLARYLATGEIDSTFGNNGTIIIQPQAGQTSVVLGAQVIDDGSIIVQGFTGDTGFAFVGRCTSDGRIDRTFGDSGFCITPYISNYPADVTAKPLIQSNGAIVGFVLSLDTCPVFRLTKSGFIDRSFGQSGRVLVPRHREPRSSVIAHDNSILIGATRDDFTASVISLTCDSVQNSVLTDALWERYHVSR